MKTPPRSKGATEIQAERSFLARKVGLRGQTIIHTAEVGGFVLIAAATIALIWANSPWRQSYQDLFHTVIDFQIGSFALETPGEGGGGEGHGEGGDSPGHSESSGEEHHGMTLHHWINDGLMVIFFFVVGLEIKRELVRGELTGLRRAALPAAIALGGMVLPASIYAAFNLGKEGISGWGIPMATDIAFAIGVLSLLGDRIPSQIRILLLAFAIVDDIGAILVIALFYTSSLNTTALLAALALLGVIVFMQRIGVLEIYPYFFVGVLIWAAMLVSGVHATIAGVVLGLMTPSEPWYDLSRYRETLAELREKLRAALDRGEEEEAGVYLGRIEELTIGTESVLDRLVRRVHPWSAYLVLPVFALANAGVEVSPDVLKQAVGSPVMWGVLLGLVVGKPVGVTVVAWIAVQIGLVELPRNVRWSHIFGIGILGSIGFTVALFITNLAFTQEIRINDAKIGILVASMLGSGAGLGFLYLTSRKRPDEQGDPATASQPH